MRFFRLAAATAMLLTLAATPALAQDDWDDWAEDEKEEEVEETKESSTAAASHRRGLWFAFGAGGGSLGFGCEGCDTERTSGVTGQVAIGATLNPHILIGLEGNGWLKDEDGGRLALGHGTLATYLYPSRTGGFFVKAGVGTAQVGVENYVTEEEVTVSGLGLLAGVGYDLNMGGVSFTPTVNYLRLNKDGENVNVIGGGLSLTFH